MIGPLLRGEIVEDAGVGGFATERLAGMPIHVFETFSGVDAIWHRQE